MEVIVVNIYTFFGYFLAFMLYSFLGWMMEIILTFVRERRFVDRGFLIGPYCPIYGYGCILMVLLLQRYKDNALVLFILSMVICLVLEYLTSYFMELIFKARWWDYSDKKYNINGRICLEYGIFFGLGGLVIIYLVHPFIINVLSNFSGLGILIVGIIMLVIYIVDNAMSFNTIFKIKGVDFKDYVDNTEEITELVKEYLIKHSRLTKRLICAFPNVRMRLNKYRNIDKK